MEIIKAVLLMLILGGVIGVLLGVASVKLYIEEDHRVEEVLAMLPGYNCGGCGNPGCAGMAAKLGKKKAVDLPDHLRVQAAKVPSSRKRKAEPASSSPVSVYIPPRDEEPAPIGSEPESAYPPQESGEDAFSESEGQLRMDLEL